MSQIEKVEGDEKHEERVDTFTVADMFLYTKHQDACIRIMDDRCLGKTA